MRFLWGVPGPAFLVLYLVLLIAAFVTGPLLARRLDVGAARRDGDGALPDPTVEELALAAGGPVRLVQTAVARLVDADVLRVGRDRALRTTGRPPASPLDRAVVDAVAGRRSATTATLTKELVRHRAVDELVAAAHRRGIVHDRAALRGPRTIAVLVAVAVLLFGVLRLVGSAPGAPIGFLVFLVLACAVVVVPTAASTASTLRVTRRGSATLAAARASSPTRPMRPTAATRPTAPPGQESQGALLAGMGVAGLVAVGGMAAYPDDEVSSLLAAPSGGGFGGGGGGGGGGDGGGGGGCGGGGGGCGGGGGGG